MTEITKLEGYHDMVDQIFGRPLVAEPEVGNSLEEQDSVGVRIMECTSYVEDVTCIGNRAQLKIKVDQQKNDTSLQVFKVMADSSISVDLINIHPEQIVFTVFEDVARNAAVKLEEAGYKVQTELNCAKVSIVGGGLGEVPGVMASFVEALQSSNISILQTVDSPTSISALIKSAVIEAAVKELREKFILD
jgi:aspartate kinase